MTRAARWPRRWRASWIWDAAPPWPFMTEMSAPPPETHNHFVFLRRTFTLETVPRQAFARVTADSRYILRVNGAVLASGPARSVPERLAYTSVDLAPALVAGENVIAALVRFYGTANAWYRPARPSGTLGGGGFLFESPDLGLLSDAAWRARAAPYRRDTPTPQRLHVEDVDLAAWPWGWEAAGYDAGAWSPAVELGMPPDAPFVSMEEADLPPLTQRVLPMSVCAERRAARALAADPLQALAQDTGAVGPDRVVALTVGGMTLAAPRLQLRGPRGAVADVYTGEDREDSGRVVIAPRQHAMRIHLDGDERTFEAYEATGFSHVDVALRGGAELGGAWAVERVAPRDERALFECDDERLNAIWRLCVRTLELCSTDAYIDCPGREQRAWIGDSYLTTLIAGFCGGDMRVAWHTLRIAAHSRRADGLLAMVSVGDVSLQPNTIADFSMHWVRGLHAYHALTGDMETLHELLPVAMDVIATLGAYTHDDGLLHDLPSWIFVDWAQTERGAVNGVLNALWAVTLDEHAALLTTAGAGEALIEPIRSAARRCREGFEQLWDEQRGLYVDALSVDGSRGTRVSQQTNAAAIAFGCAPSSRWSGVLDRILDPERLVVTPTPADVEEPLQLIVQSLDPRDFVRFDAVRDIVAAQPFFTHFLHAALMRDGRIGAVLESIMRWHAYIDSGYDTVGEYWTAPPGGGSRCHVFSATPAYDLLHHVAGIAVHHGHRVSLHPQLGSLQRVRARLPLHGRALEITVDGHGAEIHVPDGVTVEIGAGGYPSLPPGSLRPGVHRIAARDRETPSPD